MPAEIGMYFVKLYPQLIAVVCASRLLLTLLLTGAKHQGTPYTCFSKSKVML